MRGLWASLRFRLAVTGFVAIYVPVLILVGVTVVTEDTTTTALTGSSTEIDVITETRPARSPWVVATAIGLAPVAAAAAWWWAGRAVRPIDRIRSVAEDIEAGDLSRRIDLTKGPTEITGLAASFDAMLERLAAAAELQRELIEETSHELRTPLAVLRTNADVLFAHPNPTIDVYRQGLQRSKDTAQRLTTIIDELLVDARGRARTLDRQPADLVAVVRSVIESAEPLAAGNDIRVRLDGPDVLTCRVDATTVGRAISNLLDNAIRHSPPGTTVHIEIRQADTLALVAVTDHGPGVPQATQSKIFKRFWRAGHGDDGVGLGLPIAAHIAQAHGGRLTLTSPGPAGDGCRFEISITR